MGVEEVYLMPENAGIARLALDRLHINMKASFLDMRVENTQNDSTRAARLMNEMGMACIITLGGDGTNRVVSKGSGDTPSVVCLQPAPTMLFAIWLKEPLPVLPPGLWRQTVSLRGSLDQKSAST